DRSFDVKNLWPVAVAEVDPLAGARVGCAKDLVDDARPGIAQILLLKLHERHGAGVVRVRQVERETVGLMLLEPAVRERRWGEHKTTKLNQHENKWDGGDIGKAVKSK